MTMISTIRRPYIHDAECLETGACYAVIKNGVSEIFIPPDEFGSIILGLNDITFKNHKNKLNADRLAIEAAKALLIKHGETL